MSLRTIAGSGRSWSRASRRPGYFVDAVAAGDEAIEQLRFYEYDVAVIDWRMPRVSGLEVVAWARRNNRPTAMLMLTARDTPSDRIEGLDAGADDYLIKPFDFGELVARIRALQRRPRNVDGPAITRGALTLDPARREIEVHGTPVNLTSTEFNILELLLRRSPVRRRPQGHRRARLARRDPAARVQRHRRPDEPTARQAAQHRYPDRDRPRRGVPPGGSVNRRLERVNVASLRVALISTGVVAVVYAIVAMLVVMFVTNDLTAQVDTGWRRN